MNERMRYQMCSVISILIVVSPLPYAAAQGARIDTKLAGQYFEEARAICDRDSGRLWGVTLYGPMLFVDPGSRAIVASHADKDGLLRERGGVFVGRLPAD